MTGETLIDLTTSHPARTQELAEKARSAGRDYVDCGMSGGAMGATPGKMALMVGGTNEAVAACKPMFDAIAGTVTHVGGSGTGHAIKLLHNMVCHTNFLVVAEAGRLAERAGIPLETAIEVFNAGNARSYISRARFPTTSVGQVRRPLDRVESREGSRDGGRVRERIRASECLHGADSGDFAKAMETGLGAEDFTRLYESTKTSSITTGKMRTGHGEAGAAPRSPGGA